MSEPDYIVVRGVGPPLEGRWFNRNDLPDGARMVDTEDPEREGCVRMVPWSEFEVRADGALAQVYLPKAIARRPVPEQGRQENEP